MQQSTPHSPPQHQQHQQHQQHHQQQPPQQQQQQHAPPFPGVLHVRRPGDKTHFCICCQVPIAVYGRLVPCKHAFCLTCASDMPACFICLAGISRMQRSTRPLFISPVTLQSFYSARGRARRPRAGRSGRAGPRRRAVRCQAHAARRRAASAARGAGEEELAQNTRLVWAELRRKPAFAAELAAPPPAGMAALQQSSSRLAARQGAPRRSRAQLRVSASGSSYGTNFRVTTFGESHGRGVGCVIDGVPPRLPLSLEEIQFELDRRRPGQSIITTPRKEEDTAEILSGVGDGITLGTPIAVLVRNKDQRSGDYSEMSVAYRPSHADATYDFKYGIRAVAGGGRSSARETIGRVAAGAVAKKLLKTVSGTEILAFVSGVLDVESNVDLASFTLEDVESNIVRCPDQAAAQKMIDVINDVRNRGESCGGVVTCVVRGCPKGLGAPVFDKLEAELAKAMLSLPATKGFEIGSGFSGAHMTGSEHNDAFFMQDGAVRTRTNRSGGIQGGISNGEDIVLKVAFKPTSTIGVKQQTVTREGEETELRARGRHDPCVVPRAVPMVESMVALVLADQLLTHYAQCELLPRDGASSPDKTLSQQFSAAAAAH
ncbi:CS2 [Scenedesmus sp. PABB004]|nr:CS2 [Scenedesmus sp. PABB004]